MAYFALFSTSVCLIAVCYSQSFSLQQYLGNSNVDNFLSKQNIHEIRKRQEDTSHCDSYFFVEGCMNGLFQEYANVYHGCNESFIANFFQQICILNSRRSSCLTLDITSIQRNFESVCNVTSTTCSQECRSTLILSRYELDCCIPSFYNTTAVLSMYFPDLFNYSTWSNCDVEQVSQPCLPSSISAPTTQIDPTCSVLDESFSQLLFSKICRRQYRDSVFTRLEFTPGCQGHYSRNYAFLDCNANQFGTYCSTLNRQLTDSSNVASEGCTNTTTCNSLCRDILNNITNTVGCCFIQKYSTTNSWLSRDVWTWCGLESPGLCQSKFAEIQEDTNEANNSTSTTESFTSQPYVPKLTVPIVITAIFFTLVMIILCAVVAVLVKKHKSDSSKDHQPSSRDFEHEQAGHEDHIYDSIQERKDITLEENVSYITNAHTHEK